MNSFSMVIGHGITLSDIRKCENKSEKEMEDIYSCIYLIMLNCIRKYLKWAKETERNIEKTYKHICYYSHLFVANISLTIYIQSICVYKIQFCMFMSNGFRRQIKKDNLCFLNQTWFSIQVIFFERQTFQMSLIHSR